MSYEKIIQHTLTGILFDYWIWFYRSKWKFDKKEPKFFYITGSTGVGFAKDQEVNINTAYQSTFGTKVLDEFDPGLNFELGVGYDFGSIRLEGTFTQGDNYMSKASSKTLDR